MDQQTLEILRQGVWASLTGGWFYDPQLDVFSNTFHLYVWLLLLCLPFTIYLYFPTTIYVWLAYCSAIFVLFGSIKFVNYALHCVYDTNECLEEPDKNAGLPKVDNERKRILTRSKQRSNRDDQADRGIELQVLNCKSDTPPVECSSRNSYAEPNPQNADADSITSDYARDKPNSTIDLKVEIHRKNSSESSEEAVHLGKVASNNDGETEHDRSKGHYFFRVKAKRPTAEGERGNSRKLCRYASEDSQSRNSKQSNLGKTGSESQIKQTGSLELEQQDDYAYWKSNQSVRRLNSTSNHMETHLMNDHPQSLEVISKKDDAKKTICSHPQSLEVD